MLVSYSTLLLLLISSSGRSFAFTSLAAEQVTKATTSRKSFLLSASKDTPVTLPEFADADEYLSYMETVSGLPRGFASGTADGSFVSQEAPSLGNLKIRGTVIRLTEGPTESWAACFTSNKVSQIQLKNRKKIHNGSI